MKIGPKVTFKRPLNFDHFVDNTKYLISQIVEEQVNFEVKTNEKVST